MTSGDRPGRGAPSAALSGRALGAGGQAGTRLGLGLAALGRPGYLNLGHARDLGPDRGVDDLRAHAHAMLDAAWAGGIRWVDAARSYGLAEEFLAGWLAARGHGPGALTISSKWGYTYTAGWRPDAEVHEVKDHSLAALRRQLAESRELLGEHLDAYLIHSATRETGVLADRAVLAALAGLAASGVAVGLSVSGPGQAGTIRDALGVDVDGTNPFRAVQATWNLLEPSAGPALAEASAAGWAVVVKEGVGNGRLAADDERTLTTGQRAVLRRVGARTGAGWDAIALAAALAQPWSGVVLSGAATREHLAANLRALDVTLTDDDLAELTTLAERPDAYWSARSALPWT